VTRHVLVLRARDLALPTFSKSGCPCWHGGYKLDVTAMATLLPARDILSTVFLAPQVCMSIGTLADTSESSDRSVRSFISCNSESVNPDFPYF
jgi:hypothetical protein